MAYMCNTILRADNSVLHVFAEFDEVIFRQVMSAYQYNSVDMFFAIISNLQILNILQYRNFLYLKMSINAY